MPMDFSRQRLLVRLNDSDAQLALADALREALGDAYVVALNLAPSTPAWLRALNAEPMVLGLDLQGGVHFLMEVDMETARVSSLSASSTIFVICSETNASAIAPCAPIVRNWLPSCAPKKIGRRR